MGQGLQPGWGTLRDISAYTGLSVRSVRTLLKKGLAHSRVNRKLILIRFKAVDKFLEALDRPRAEQIVTSVLTELED